MRPLLRWLALRGLLAPTVREAALRAALRDRARSVAEAAEVAVRRGHPALVPEADCARAARDAFAEARRRARVEPVEASLIGPDKVGRGRDSRRKVLDLKQSRGHYGAGF